MRIVHVFIASLVVPSNANYAVCQLEFSDLNLASFNNRHQKVALRDLCVTFVLLLIFEKICYVIFLNPKMFMGNLPGFPKFKVGQWFRELMNEKNVVNLIQWWEEIKLREMKCECDEMKG